MGAYLAIISLCSPRGLSVGQGVWRGGRLIMTGRRLWLGQFVQEPGDMSPIHESVVGANRYGQKHSPV